jgi:hypothetical protein
MNRIAKKAKMMISYRVLPRKNSSTCDVQATGDDGRSRVVNTFNREADAWQWVVEQEHVGEICARIRKGPRLVAKRH